MTNSTAIDAVICAKLHTARQKQAEAGPIMMGFAKAWDKGEDALKYVKDKGGQALDKVKAVGKGIADTAKDIWTDDRPDKAVGIVPRQPRTR